MSEEDKHMLLKHQHSTLNRLQNLNEWGFNIFKFSVGIIISSSMIDKFAEISKIHSVSLVKKQLCFRSIT